MAAMALQKLIPSVRPTQPDWRVGASTLAARAFGTDGVVGPLSLLERLVLARLWLQAGASGLCWLPYVEVAASVGASTKSVQRTMRSLQAKGLLEQDYVLRGGELLNGYTAENSRMRCRLTPLPDTAVHGLRGDLALAFDPKLILSRVHRGVLAMLLLHGNEAGWTFVGLETISAKLGLVRSTVVRALRVLERAGHIQVRRDKARWGATNYVERRATPRPGLVCPKEAGHPVLAGWTPSDPKEIREADPPQTPAGPEQLTLPFDALRGKRSLADVALEAHAAICKAPAGPEAKEQVKGLLGEGLSVKDVALACTGVMTSPWRKERLERREVGQILRTKGQAVEFIRRVDPVRAEAIEAAVPAPPKSGDELDKKVAANHLRTTIAGMVRPVFR